MAIEEGFSWAKDGERLFYRFQPGLREKNPILLLHGHGEHSGRYLKFFSRLEGLQCPIAAFDLRGSGRSSGTPVYVRRFEDYLEDVSSFVDFLKLRYSIDPPFQLVGHSLGGLIATAWAREQTTKVSKLILSSPLFDIPLPRPLRVFVNFFNRFLPGLVIKNPVHPPFLTHDPEEIKRYRTDPLIQRKITLGLVHEMLRYAALFKEEEVSLPFPVYILMAEEDFVVSPEATRRFFLRLRAPVKELESLPGFFHEIFNETGQERAFERLRYYLGRS